MGSDRARRFLLTMVVSGVPFALVPAEAQHTSGRRLRIVVAGQF
jgi:hypothetical protein